MTLRWNEVCEGSFNFGLKNVWYLALLLFVKYNMKYMY